MSIKYFSIIITLFISESIIGQITNGSFEFWEGISNYEKPVGWSTNQNPIYSRFEKDTLSTDGMYSLKIIPGPTSSWQLCESHATVHVKFDTPLASNSNLTFYVKTIPEDPSLSNDVYLIVDVSAYSSDSSVSKQIWAASSVLEDFTKVNIPLFGENIESIRITITGGAGTSAVDGPCQARSFTWIDGMAIEDATSLPPIQEISNLFIYPNPTSDLLNIQFPDEWKDSGETIIRVLDQTGREQFKHQFFSKDGTNILSLASLRPGIYFISIRSGKNWSTGKVIKI